MVKPTVQKWRHDRRRQRELEKRQKEQKLLAECQQLIQAKQFEECIRTAARAEDQFPSSSAFPFFLGFAHLGLATVVQKSKKKREAKKEGERAAAALERSIKLKSANADAHYYLGVALELQERHREAIRSYSEALQQNAEHQLAETRLNNLEAKSKRPKRRKDANPKLLFNQCDAHFRARRYNECVQASKLAAHHCPKDARFPLYTGLSCFQLSAIYHRQNKSRASRKHNSMAISSIKNSIKLDRSNATAYYYLGLAYERAEDRKGAVASYRKALDCSSNHQRAWARLMALVE